MSNCYVWGSPGPGFFTVRGVYGTGDAIEHNTPTLVVMPVGVGVVKAVSNIGASLFLGDDGLVYFSGYNGNGMSGDGSTDSSAHLTPTVISALTDIVDIAIGTEDAFALDSAGDMYGWGTNSNGTLGVGDQSTHYTPGVVQSSVHSMAAGFEVSALRLTSGQVQTCGINHFGALGQGISSLTTVVSTWTNIAGSDTISKVACGANQVVYILADGTVKASGNGFPHTPGNAPLGPTIYNGGSAPTYAISPTAVPGPTGIVDGYVFDSQSVYLDASGVWYLYGEIGSGDGAGNTGHFDVGQSTNPIVVAAPGALTFTSLPMLLGGGTGVPSTPAGFAAAIGSDGLLYTWGGRSSVTNPAARGFHGSGADVHDNPLPISVNGMTAVTYAMKQQLFIFAVGSFVAPGTPTHPAQMVSIVG